MPGQDQVDPRRAHVGKRADGARELALERPAQVDVGQEVGGPEGAAGIEDLIADRPAAGQVLFGERHAQAKRLIGGHQDGIAVAAQPVGHAHRLEPAHDLGAVVQLKAAIEQGVGGLDRVEEQIAEAGEQREAGGAQDQEPPDAETAQHARHPRSERGRIAIGGGVSVARRKRAERLVHRLAGEGA